ncbi:hypothetical protein EV199_3687 [Pseudobacter ginsenosidimutans]|uniref:Uncharacterized protein n=1 Tax=Pseudobacter ginsenosidimutans TaxID=661488 RepID=A0A4Q7MSI3_9BACT|nr:hypothetical protein EV199_3687 [Pseudobacter ginsenosidimutans]
MQSETEIWGNKGIRIIFFEINGWSKNEAEWYKFGAGKRQKGGAGEQKLIAEEIIGGYLIRKRGIRWN